MRPVFRREAPAQLHHDRMRCDPSRRCNYLRLPNPRLRNRRGRPHAQRGRGDNSQTGDLDLTHCGSPFVPWKHLNLAENPPPACDRCHKMADFAEPRACERKASAGSRAGRSASRAGLRPRLTARRRTSRSGPAAAAPPLNANRPLSVPSGRTPKGFQALPCVASPCLASPCVDRGPTLAPGPCRSLGSRRGKLASRDPKTG